jgi:hypothetical protein
MSLSSPSLIRMSRSQYVCMFGVMVIVGFVLNKNRVLEPFKSRNEEADIAEFGFHWDNDTGAFADKAVVDAVVGNYCHNASHAHPFRSTHALTGVVMMI